MPESLADYLDLSPADARAQWRRIAARGPRSRQEIFLPVEVLLCYGLFQVVNPHRYGGRNITSVPPAVSTLAATMKRPIGSITNKMLNLEGARANAARLEPELFARLAREADHFASLYRIVIEAARGEGLGAESVPDFLAVEIGSEGQLVGQEELGSVEIAQALEENRREVGRLERTFDLPERDTTMIVERRVRLGQHRFAVGVLENFAHQCGFCGLAPRDLRPARLLIASHVKPWRHSTNRERLDVRNGIAACPTHDAAFDAGLLAVDARLHVVRAGVLERVTARDELCARFFGDSAVGSTLVLPEGAVRPAAAYLEHHLTRIFRRDE